MEVVKDNNMAVEKIVIHWRMIFSIFYCRGLIQIGGGAINTSKCQCPRANANPLGMKNLPIAIGIAAMSFKGLEMLPVAVGFAFQMLTAVTFYQLFRNDRMNTVNKYL